MNQFFLLKVKYCFAKGSVCYTYSKYHVQSQSAIIANSPDPTLIGTHHCERDANGRVNLQY